MQQIKKILPGIAAVLLIVAGCIWMFGDGAPSQITDTNGPDDFTLTTITDENIINRDIGSIGGPTISQGLIGDGYTFSAKEFSGVYEILYDNFIGKSDFQLDITNFVVTGGNFRMVVVHDDQIVAELTPDMFVEYRLEDIKGTVSLRIAGESASFSFFMANIDYNAHSHG